MHQHLRQDKEHEDRLSAMDEWLGKEEHNEDISGQNKQM